MLKNILLCFVITFLVGIIIAPVVIYFSKKLKFGQNILHYVKEHKNKQGTPTMGGIIFLFSISIVCLLFFGKDSSLALVCLAVMLAFACLGFLDDFIKIKYKQNEGLKPYQKIVGQLGISTLVALFAYTNNYVGTSIIIPFSTIQIDLMWFIIPFTIFVLIAIVNSVNLLDGLDGLCGGVSFSYLIGTAFVLLLLTQNQVGHAVSEYNNIIVMCFSACGGLLAFLCYNAFPAKIFMGDTGSLALGGLIGSIAILTRTELYIVILGIMFVITALSDVIQVLYYKRTKKRVFLMAPLHHHFQMKKMHENKISFVYIVITLMVSLISVLLLEVCL